MTNTSKKKIDQLIMDCYRELYKNSIPNADFDDLMKNATINELGQKEIPFNNYEIDDVLFWTIIDKYANQIRPKYKIQMFKNTIALGCSPKSKINSNKLIGKLAER